jgi:hypothetical protein
VSDKEKLFDCARQQLESLLDRSDLTENERWYIHAALEPLDILCKHRTES